MERPKIRETDNVRALYLCTFFIEFFLLSRTRATAAAASDVKGKGREDDDVSKVWDFGYVAEFAEIDAVKWVVGRMRIVMEDKVSDARSVCLVPVLADPTVLISSPLDGPSSKRPSTASLRSCVQPFPSSRSSSNRLTDLRTPCLFLSCS